MKISKNLRKIIDSKSPIRSLHSVFECSSLKLYTGPQPKSPDLPQTGQLVVDFGLVRFKRSKGFLLNSEVLHGTTVSSDPVCWFRLQGRDSALDGSISVNGYGRQADLILSCHPVIGETMAVDIFSIDLRALDYD